MDDFFTYDPSTIGSKGLVFIGEDVLVYRRDGNTNNHPFQIDLPGGGPEDEETPFETFQREVKEEFGLTINQSNIVYVRKYPSSLNNGRVAYYPVAKLPKECMKDITLGTEGLEYMLLPPSDYIKRRDAWDVFQERALDYLKTLN